MRVILFVDDSGLFAEFARRIERRTPCRLLTARNGAEALTVARRESPDMIFLDSEMSGMTGIDVCRVLKADSRFARTPVVVVSAEREHEACRRAGADEFLSRSLDEAVILESIRRHLQLPSRDEARAPVGWTVTFWRDGAQHNGTLRDLSLGGFFIRTVVRQPIGARLEVSFDVPGAKAGRTVVAEAIVVRIGQEPDPGLGCRFFRLTAGPRANLEDCLQMIKAGGAEAAASGDQGTE